MNADKLTIRQKKLDRHLGLQRWKYMMARCYDEEHMGYDNYGGRGIGVVKRWHDFGAYYEDVGDPPEPGMTIDRPKVDEDYGPGNWRWATLKEQAANRRPRELPHANATSFVYHEKRVITIKKAAGILGCLPETLAKRLAKLRKRGVFEVNLADLKQRSDEARAQWTN